MRTAVLVSALALAVVLSPLNVRAQQASDNPSVVERSSGAVEAPPQFVTLGGAEAVRMAPAELEAVKGMHVHFENPAGKVHLAGNPFNNGIGFGNWYNNGSPDAEAGFLVAPSYHGLCVAPPIFISATGPGGVPTLDQCP